MADVVVTVPKRLWAEWLAEGDLPGEPESGQEYDFYFGGREPSIKPGERVYIVAHDRLRGYAPLKSVEWYDYRSWAFRRAGGAVALTIGEKIRGFRGWRYRWWDRADEVAFDDWRNPNAFAGRT